MKGPPKPDIKHCNYYQALEHSRSKLQQCKYCKRYFCEAHIHPTPARLFASKNRGEYNSLSKSLQEEINNPNSHPCASYNSYFEKKIEAEKESYRVALRNVLIRNQKFDISPKTKNKTEEKKTFESPGLEYLNRIKKEENTSKTKEKEITKESMASKNKTALPKVKVPNRFNRKYLWLILFIFLLIVLYAFGVYKTKDFSLGYFNEHSEKAIEEQIPPHFLNLSDEAFSLINNYREAYNLPKLTKSNNALLMAFTLTKNDSERSKILSEEGIHEVAQRYGLEGNVIVLSGDINEQAGLGANYRVIRWVMIAKDKLLNSSLVSGAVACSDKVCYFVAATEVPKPASNTNLSTNKPLGQRFLDWISEIIINFPTGNNASVDNSEYSNDAVNNAVSPLKPSINIPSLEKEVHDLINSERQNNGLSTLSLDSKLSDIARAHSMDMAQNNFFSHENLRSQDPTARATASGYKCYKNYGDYYTVGIAENIFQNNLYDSITYIDLVPIHNWNTASEIAQSTVQGWMNSPGHRQNILTKTYDREGIGVAISNDDKIYITEDFC
jgi:uncharacterized protein YkwD